MQVSGYCPVCDRLVGLSPTGERQGRFGTSTWWRVDMHAAAGKICEGSGRRV